MGYEVTLIDRISFLKIASNQKINAIPILLKIKGISALKHKSEKFALAIF